MNIECVTLSDVVDFHARELSNEEWSRIEARRDSRVRWLGRSSQQDRSEGCKLA
jgi:hypothetical protein